ncbi:succinate dehydrogenase assembly factor 4, mitochondrial [Hyla sarda]|uniref:succinate dehydrogenase assembly factor 4, mitochondrial n=1 Tax=Hyla sarda TaxID=327740 RepID=UPI0024C310C4|nr:succinate dehydrogenase assembly factor 4, mitochondrial [Hyla sarda]
MCAMRDVLCRCTGAAGVLLRSHPLSAGKLGWVRAGSNIPTQGSGSTKPPLKKPKTPQGRLDETEQAATEREPLERFPDGINPITKEKGGPRGPEPTRYGDWERKGRCIDF